MTGHEATVRVPFEASEAAERARAALAPDDDDHVVTRVEPGAGGGAVLVVEARGASPGALLAALDDVLACLSAVEGVVDVVDEA